MNEKDEITRYKLGDDNPSGMEWTVLIYPEKHGYSMTITNAPPKVKVNETKPDASIDSRGAKT